ncbi:hypothetical protein J6590_037003 [Homalodisca vitripennis]|nr:hypothetical protein J6590_037003 [Homalodisca vitripennis]
MCIGTHESYSSLIHPYTTLGVVKGLFDHSHLHSALEKLQLISELEFRVTTEESIIEVRIQTVAECRGCGPGIDRCSFTQVVANRAVCIQLGSRAFARAVRLVGRSIANLP